MRAVLLTALLACAAAAAFAVQIRHEMADFEVYRTAGARAAAVEPLYRASDGHYQFKYFPAVAFLFVPLAALPATAAKAVWFALSVALLASFLALSLGALPGRVMPSALLVTATILTLGKFYAHELTLGQANLLFGVSAVAALARLQRSRDSPAGMLFGASALIKPYGLVFLPYLVVTRRFRAAGAAAGVVAVGAVAPALVYGVGGNLDLLAAWGRAVVESTPANLTNQDNVSIAAMYAKWLGPGPTAGGLAMATSLGLVALCGAVVAMRPAGHRTTESALGARPEYLEVALLLTAVALLSPQGWDYVLLLSTPAVMLLVNALPALPRVLQVATAACLAATGLTIYDVMGREAYGRFMALSALTVVYGVLIGVVVYMRARHVR
ncbi:MAG: DUF2029 domain-containing protein [Acidobacteria bacterium]|nr:DUF2029 domain-containing protein [Acidobacteriota bacterium]